MYVLFLIPQKILQIVHLHSKFNLNGEKVYVLHVLARCNDLCVWQVLLYSGVSAYDKFYCTVGCPPITSYTVQWGVRVWQVLLYSGCPHMTSFTVQWGVRVWQVLLYSGVSAYDNFYHTVGCLPMASFTVICVFYVQGLCLIFVLMETEMGRVKNGKKHTIFQTCYNVKHLSWIKTVYNVRVQSRIAIANFVLTIANKRISAGCDYTLMYCVVMSKSN